MIALQMIMCLLLLGCTASNLETQIGRQVFRATGVEAHFELANDSLLVNLDSPGTGWVGIGFNNHAGLAGTNLILASVKFGEMAVSDRFVVSPGVHKADIELGGVDNISRINGAETNGKTRVSFKIPLQTGDKFDFELTPGKSLWLMLAWSESDDWNHHSRNREQIKIRLNSLK